MDDGLDTNPSNKNNLLVICEGRKIGFQVDLSVDIDPQELLGRSFELELGSIGYCEIKVLHGKNPMDPLKSNVRVRRNFGDLNLSNATTAFTFTRKLTNEECNENELKKNCLSNQIRTDVASTIDTERDDGGTVVTRLSCVNHDTVEGTVELHPPSNGSEARIRRLGTITNKNIKSTTFREFQNDLSDKGDLKGRRHGLAREDGSFLDERNFMIRHVNIIPHESDMSLFETSINHDKEAEELLYHIASMHEASDVMDMKQC